MRYLRDGELKVTLAVIQSDGGESQRRPLNGAAVFSGQGERFKENISTRDRLQLCLPLLPLLLRHLPQLPSQNLARRTFWDGIEPYYAAPELLMLS